MSDIKTNQFGGALLFILGEFAVAEDEMLEDGGMEVFGEDDQGREGSCEVSINELAQAASDEIKYLTDQLAKANERIAELKKDVLEEIENRDNREEWLDKLSDEISRYLGVDIGEHSSANNPWREALDSIPEVALNKFAINQQKKGIKDYISTLDRNLPEKVYLSYLAKDALLYCDNLDKELR